MKRLKEKWNIESNFQLGIIFTVFAVNGSLAVALVKPIMNFIGLNKELVSGFLFWPIRILLMFIVYQILLIVIGTLFGQHEFFWNMQKKTLARLGVSRFKNYKNEE
ncbi:diacylglyceryl transferase [Joostella atrarenae]|uniref:Diacylglyceryl transferase n=1 Tax=Joostella atrarenae TaxID=679257 RepID=A0ABS9J1Z5_9FLAO|nr:DUF6787 family protein [Joostella atrarenae]MCF8714440.1 diacylglyceryl transferase [Joostella atrarenae]